MKKISKILIITIILSLFTSTFAFAEVDETSMLKIKFKDFYLETEYNKDEFSAKYNKDNSIEIIDKKTKSVIEIITCAEDKISKNIMASEGRTAMLMASASSGTYTFYTVTRSITDSLATVTASVRLWVYTNGSFGQIEYIDNSKIIITSSCSAELKDEDISANSTTNSFPTKKITYSGSGTITITTTKEYGDELSVGFSIPEIMEMGYSASTSTGAVYYLRKFVQISGAYSMY